MAEEAGGEARGRQAPPLLVVGGERTEPADGPAPVDLRVADSDDPLAELRLLLALNRGYQSLGSLFATDVLGGTGDPGSETVDEALEVIERSLRWLPGRAEPLMWQAIVLARARRAQQAREAAAQAVQRNPELRVPGAPAGRRSGARRHVARGIAAEMTALLEINGLRVTIPVGGLLYTVIHDVSLVLGVGEALAIVGESGAGKSMTVRAILRMLPASATVEGGLRFDGREISQLGDAELRRYRADGVGVVFQDPRAHVNPVRRVGDFMIEPLVRLRGMRPAAARERVAAILTEIGVADGERRFRQFPHELSGGLLQRMMIASVVAMEPRLILADEPTTALDATTQSDVMAILLELRASHDLALLLVTHDLDLGAAVCDRMAVMYAGTIVEERSAGHVIDDPLHPYGRARRLAAGAWRARDAAAGDSRPPAVGVRGAAGLPIRAALSVRRVRVCCAPSDFIATSWWPRRLPARR